MIFAGQKWCNSAARYTPPRRSSTRSRTSAYVDEVIYFTDKQSLVDSFRDQVDDVWTSTTGMLANYANVTTMNVTTTRLNRSIRS